MLQSGWSWYRAVGQKAARPQDAGHPSSRDNEKENDTMAMAHPADGGQSIPVVIVDDARFTLEVLRRVLRETGYTDIRVAPSAREALSMMRERAAGILLADWLMPETDGLTLTRQVRQLDEDAGHYTYIILLTAREGAASLTEAFDSGVDDFISKSPDNKELLARIQAAGRISRLQNDLLVANRQLTLLGGGGSGDGGERFDPDSAAGNRGYVGDQLSRLLRHVESRGGSACVALVKVPSLGAIADEHGASVAAEVRRTVGERLRRAVRPLDTVATLDSETFGVLMHHEHPDGCHPHTFRRVHQALNLRAYRTQAGFLNASAAISLTALGQDDAGAQPGPEEVLEVAGRRLTEAGEAARVLMTSWRR